MYNYLILHGASGIKDAKWAGWLKEELEGDGNEVILPCFPSKLNATPERWEDILGGYKGSVSQSTVVIAHSIGCLLAINYLSKKNLAVRALVFVAGADSKKFAEGLPKDKAEYLREVIYPFLPSKGGKSKIKDLVREIICV